MADRAEGDPDPNECQQRAAVSARQVLDHFKAIPKLPKSGIAGESVSLPESLMSTGRKRSNKRLLRMGQSTKTSSSRTLDKNKGE